MNISDLSGKTRYINEVDVIEGFYTSISGKPIQLYLADETGARTLLTDEYYFGDFQNEIHLHYRDVFNRMASPRPPHLAPSMIEGVGIIDPSQSAACTDYHLTMPGSAYHFSIRSYCNYLDEYDRMSSADFLEVAEDTEIAVTFADIFSSFTIAATDGKRTVTVVTKSSSASNKGLWTFTFRPSKVGMDIFQIQLRTNRGTIHGTTYKVVHQQVENYCFLTGYGYETFPMTGALQLRPECMFSNGRVDDHLVATSRFLSENYTQKTGPLSRQSAAALISSLSSGHVFHNVESAMNGGWKEIVIDTASIEMSSHNGMNYGSFSWQYAEDIPASVVLL